LEIQSRTFFVTGGGSGLGAATARLIAEVGGNVVIADVDDEAGESVAGEIGEKARFQHTDVTDERSVRAAIDAARETFGGLHGLVN
jgi:NAD(P)-dependent dehydrogenase (short-subunit alcohol dehydrogenase family)